MYQEKLKQVQNELTQTEKIIADFFQNHSLEARSFTSVSYTHLDVYKRPV